MSGTCAASRSPSSARPAASDAMRTAPAREAGPSQWASTHVVASPDASTNAGSASIARWNGTEVAEKLLDRADHALYLAKTAGRNQCQLSEPAASPASPGGPTAAKVDFRAIV